MVLQLQNPKFDGFIPLFKQPKFWLNMNLLPCMSILYPFFKKNMVIFSQLVLLREYQNEKGMGRKLCYE